jgi:hypothetical protein
MDRNQYTRLVVRFSAQVQAIANAVAEKFPNDLEFVRAKRQLNLAIDNTPVQTMNTIGDHLLPHAQAIIDRDVAFFTSIDFAVKGSAAPLFGKIRTAFMKADEDEKMEYFDAVERLLTIYVEAQSNK